MGGMTDLSDSHTISIGVLDNDSLALNAIAVMTSRLSPRFHISISEWTALCPHRSRRSAQPTRLVTGEQGQSATRNIFPYLRMLGPI